jgi:hypothetical protein
MKEFIKSLFSDKDGSVSSKRLVMFLLTFLFAGVTVYNIITGKNLDETLKNQLFYLLVYVISVVFGENVTGMFKKPDPK